MKQKTNLIEDKEVAKELENELDIFSDLEILEKSNGGKIIIDSLTKDIIANVEALSGQFSKLSLQEFVAISAQIKEKLDLLRVITRAKKNKKIVSDEIERLIAPALQE